MTSWFIIYAEDRCIKVSLFFSRMKYFGSYIIGFCTKNWHFHKKVGMVCSQLMATVAPPGEFRQRRCHNFRGLNSEYSQSFNTFNNLQYSSSNSCLLTECIIKIVKELQCMSILNKFLKTFEIIGNSLFTLLTWSLVTFLT